MKINGYAIEPGAYLYGALLQGADLRDADLRFANLRGARLQGARLRGANLQDAILRDAILRDADLQGANLEGANLRDAYLRDAYLYGANLRGTCLDPEAIIPEQDLSELGEVKDGYVYAWRTAKSMHVGNNVYEPGQTYVAPVFSVDDVSSCHPGIYLASMDWLEAQYGLALAFVRVRARVSDVLRAGGKYRARRIEVL